ncbi:MAG: hypothetical protein ABIH89_00985 [Elusimicrobiota bacterium]
MHHLEHPVSVLSRIYKALAPGGRAVFMDPNPCQPAWIPYISFHPVLSWKIERRIFFYTPGRSMEMMKSAGFGRIGDFYAGLLPPFVWKAKNSLPSRLEKGLRRIPGLLKIIYLQDRSRI